MRFVGLKKRVSDGYKVVGDTALWVTLLGAINKGALFSGGAMVDLALDVATVDL